MNTDINGDNDKSQSTPPHILVVDDDPLILNNIEVLLTRKGCRVTTVSLGVVALRKVHEDPPDAILLDVVMPDTDGYEVCRRIKSEQALRHIPVLLLTALNDIFSKVKGLDAGADDFIGKPFNEAELRARLWAHLRNKQLHDELQASYRKLQELETMKEALTHMLIHDVSAPLSAVHFGLEAAIDALDEGNTLSSANERMLRASMLGCRRVIGMLRDVLIIQKLEENKFPIESHPVKVGPLIAACLLLIEPARAASEVTIRTSVAADLPLIFGDEKLLTRVLNNLVSNALKFTPKGGNVNVSAHQISNSEIEVAVTDNGIGIPSAYLTRIFDKYVQVQGNVARHGVGLGLTFCRLAVDAHGGKIWAENNPDRGSRFVFRLPIETYASVPAVNKAAMPAGVHR